MEKYTEIELDMHAQEYSKLSSAEERHKYLCEHTADWFSLGKLKRIYRELGGTNSRLSSKVILYNEIINKSSIVQFLNSD